MARKRPHHGSNRRGRSQGPRKPRKVLTGTLRVLRPGVACVETPEGTFDVARQGLREAMNGDEVQVFLADGRGGRKAIVHAVLGRATQTFLGRFGQAGPLGAVVPLDTRMGHDFFVVPEDPSPRWLGVAEGDVVVARITEYPTRYTAATVTLDRRVGSSDELDMDVESVIASHGLATDFSPATLAEAEEVVPAVGEALAADPQRRDLRDVMCVTIDPDAASALAVLTAALTWTSTLPTSPTTCRGAAPWTWTPAPARARSTSWTASFPCCPSGCATTCARCARRRTAWP